MKIIFGILIFFFLMAVVYFGFLFFAHDFNNDFLDIDSCLDKGGTWNYETRECEYSETDSIINQLDKIQITGRLINICYPMPCGIFHSGGIAVYNDLEILSGDYSSDSILVVHGCPDMYRNIYTKNGGNLKTFKLGDRHNLTVSDQNVFKVEFICNFDSTANLFYSLIVDSIKYKRN